MKNMLNYLFWKNVYHIKWLYISAVIYLFITTKDMRRQVSLVRGIARVEAQDQYRVDMIRLNEALNEIKKLLSDITEYVVAASLAKQIQPK